MQIRIPGAGQAGAFARALCLATAFVAPAVGAAAPAAAMAAQPAAAPFAAHADIGAPKLPGSAVFGDGRYTVRAAGANMMAAHDEFHFVWRKLTGDFSISARVMFAGPGVQAHRKAGLMARAGLGDAAAYVDATVHGNGPKALQVRRANGGPTEMLIVQAPEAAPAAAAPLAYSPGEQALPAGPTPPPRTVQLERHGRRFTVTIREAGQPDVRRELSDADLPDTLYVGLFLCAHDPDVLETAVFDQVRLVPGG